jgi:hypothetical protein
LKKQGCAFGYTKVRGLHPLLATLSETGEAAHARLRGGNAGSARGAASFVAETISRVRQAGATGQLTIRADSALDSKAVIGACRKADVRFSITVKLDKRSAPRSTPYPMTPGSRSRIGNKGAPTSPRLPTSVFLASMQSRCV